MPLLSPPPLHPLPPPGFMLNLSTVLLRLMQSLYTIAPTANLAKVDPHYPAAPDCRLPFSNESCLAKGTISELQSGRSVLYEGVPVMVWGCEVVHLLTFVPDLFVRLCEKVTDGTVLHSRQ